LPSTRGRHEDNDIGVKQEGVLAGYRDVHDALLDIFEGQAVVLASADSPNPIALAPIEDLSVVVDAANIPGGSDVGEQSPILYDPGAIPTRQWVLWTAVAVAGVKRVYVVFSSDGEEWSLPIRCVMGAGDRASDDPSIVSSFTRSGEVLRFGGKLYMYVEDTATSDIYAYEGTDGVNWTEMSGNPVIVKGAGGTWESFLAGSPCAYHNGTEFIIGYEGLITGSYGAAFGIAHGVTPNGLTKLAANPVLSTGMRVDEFFRTRDGERIILLGGSIPGLGSGFTSLLMRAQTWNLDPLTWSLDDFQIIPGFLGLESEELAAGGDFTLDHTIGPNRVIVRNIPRTQLIRFRFIPALGRGSRPYRPGSYYTGSGPRSSVQLANGVMGAWPFEVIGSLPIDRIGCEVVTAGSAGALVRLGIYQNNDAGAPKGLLLDAGTIDATVTGWREITINRVLGPGIWWLVAVTQGAPSTLPFIRCFTQPQSPFGGFLSSAALIGTTPHVSLEQIGVTGGLPMFATDTPGSSAAAPLVGVRAV
jgi:hypothetical protein